MLFRSIGVPAPFAAIPVTVATLSLTQVKVVPVVLLVNTILDIAEPLQIVCDAGVAIAFGVGFTNTVAITAVPVQVVPALV